MRHRGSLLAAAVVLTCTLGWAGSASAAIFLPTTTKEAQQQKAATARYDAGITPPAPPCPENGLLYPEPSQIPAGVPYLLGNCGVAQPAATGTPWMGNMAYYGGHVQVHPKEYLVYWGWGEPGAFPQGSSCTPQPLSEGQISATLGCDPDGAGKYMADFVHQMGGTGWANVSTQYYETDQAGNKQYVHNDGNVLAGIWTDDTNDASILSGTNSGNPPGPGNTYWDLAKEASRAAAHFGVTGSALTDANFIVIQPPNFSDPNALAIGYCAFHDYTDSRVPGNGYYANASNGDSVEQGISYTNMPYALAINSNGVNVCGQSAVNSDTSDASVGKLDGFSIVLGHEIEETITDPGAEDVVGVATSSNPTPAQTYEGGWYDTTDPNENGDKCAWVGENLLTGQGPPLPIYGALGNITGNAGEQFAVQSLWSNAANEGTGYCAGANSDSPAPPAPYGTVSAPTNQSPPTISGDAVQGQTLTENHGSWTDDPTTYYYQWADCDANGQNCSPIAAATAQTYTPKASDVGDTLIVEETTMNDGGYSAPAVSSPTQVVTASSSTAPTGPTGAPGPQGAAGPQGGSGPQGAQNGSSSTVNATVKPGHHAVRAKRTAKRHPAKKRGKRHVTKKHSQRR